MTDTDSDLREFIEDEKRPPMLRPDEEVDSPTGKGHITVGYRGPIPARSAYGFLQYVDSDEHFHRNAAGYALSESVLRRIRSFGCKRVLFAEEDTGMVYEFHISQFEDNLGAKNNPEHDTDPQRYVEILENRGKWHAHANMVLYGERGGH